MPGRINDEDIELLRERADLALIAGDYTSLTRAGSRLKGLCPFHQERTPSFHVEAARGLFHCFGCGAGGDVYGFLQQVEALTFPEAVERLARIVGYELRYEQLSPGQRRALGRRTRLGEAAAEAAGFFVDQLAGDDGAQARAYLAGRGLSSEEVARFRVGWAPDQWDTLVRHLRARRFTDEEIAAAGLATPGRRGLTDRFRGRVVFPILDVGGRDVVAFGGRVLPGRELRTAPREGEAPKYINSPETDIYKKSRTLYALNWARVDVQRRDTALVVEGYMDVIGLHTAGIRHAVATCGTALTVEHFHLLERFANRVVLALDADEAGYAAAERARELAAEAGLREVGVLPLAPGQDPADLAAEGVAAVEAALAATQTAVEFQITHLLRTADMATPEGQVAAYRRTFPLLARLPDRFLRYSYIRDIVAPAVRLPADRIEQELDHELARGRQGGRAPPEAGGRVPPKREQHAPAARPGDVTMPRDPQMRLEREVLQVALQRPDLLPDAWSDVSRDDFRAPMSGRLFTALTEAPAGDLAAILASLADDEERARVRALALSEPTVPADGQHVVELVARLRAAAVQRRIDAVRERLSMVNEHVDAEQRRRLTADLYALQRLRRELVERPAGQQAAP